MEMKCGVEISPVKLNLFLLNKIITLVIPGVPWSLLFISLYLGKAVAIQ